MNNCKEIAVGRTYKNNPDYELTGQGKNRRYRKKYKHANKEDISLEEQIKNIQGDFSTDGSQYDDPYDVLVHLSSVTKQIFDDILQDSTISAQEKSPHLLEAYTDFDYFIGEFLDEYGLEDVFDEKFTQETHGLVYARIKELGNNGTNDALVRKIQESVNDYLENTNIQYTLDGKEKKKDWDEEWDTENGLIHYLSVHDAVSGQEASQGENIVKLFESNKFRISYDDKLATSMISVIEDPATDDILGSNSYYIYTRDFHDDSGKKVKGYFLYKKNPYVVKEPYEYAPSEYNEDGTIKEEFKRKEHVLQELYCFDNPKDLIMVAGGLAGEGGLEKALIPSKESFNGVNIAFDTTGEERFSHLNENGLDPINVFRGHSLASEHARQGLDPIMNETEINYYSAAALQNENAVSQDIDDAWKKTFGNIKDNATAFGKGALEFSNNMSDTAEDFQRGTENVKKGVNFTKKVIDAILRKIKD